MNENPFHYMKKEETSTSIAETERAIQETQAAMVIAKRFPRDQGAAMEKILEACSRPLLAEKAVYAYEKGDDILCEASVHLARAIAQIWGNIQFGIREIDQAKGQSTVQSFAWDLESNTKEVREFQVKHQRKAYGKVRKITDPREIYEHVANMGARRMRACLLNVIPRDVVEAAKQKCEQTSEANDKKSLKNRERRVKSMIMAFEAIGIDKDLIRKRLNHPIKDITDDDFVNLKKIYRSIRDGETDAAHWFKDYETKSETTSEIMTLAKYTPSEPKELEPEPDKTEPSTEETRFNEKWFNKGISEAKTDEEITEFEAVLRDTDLHPEVKLGIEHKIAARRAELNATE